MGTELRATHYVANFKCSDRNFCPTQSSSVKDRNSEGRQLNVRLPLIPYRPTRAINEAG